MLESLKENFIPMLTLGVILYPVIKMYKRNRATHLYTKAIYEMMKEEREKREDTLL